MNTLHEIIRVHSSTPLNGTILPPSSKYHTLRYILAAFLALGKSTVFYPAVSDDTDVLLHACRQLGAQIHIERREDERSILSILGTGGILRTPSETTIDVGNAGAVLRLLLGICALSLEPITFTTPYPQSLGRRPNADLLQALTQLGAFVESPTDEGTLPIKIHGGQVHGGHIRISGKKSSQYISALLFLAPLLKEGLEIEIVDALTSASFLDLTIEVLEQAGISVIIREPYKQYVVPGMQLYQSGDYVVPGDYPSATALLAAVAIAKGEITITNLQAGDANGEAILEVFSEMGMKITRNGNAITAISAGDLNGVTIDGNRTIDSVPVITAAACFCESPSRIYNIANLHTKESDRINDLAQELNKAGCHVIPSADSIEIYPAHSDGIHGGVELDAHSDHRLIQAFGAVGLAVKHPITISGSIHIAKSYPQFFHDLNRLGAKIESVY
ncbi:MAG: 3-phosphoshikimate 1-carboxyvinyltransferase [Ktedonobacteraceae bacterium]